MSLQFKAGVHLLGLRPEMVAAMNVVASIYQERNLDCVVTSAVDGQHGRNSCHFKGCGLDFRTRNVHPSARNGLTEAIKSALGNEFDVVLEKDHLHVEWDPETGVNM